MPVVFVVHVTEEAPRFVAWFNSLVTPGISQPLFLSVNGVAFLITVIVAFAVATVREPAAGLTGAAWVGFLFLANGIFHIIGTVALGRYCPGVVTGTLFYLPFSLLFLRAVVRELGEPAVAVGIAALLGGAPMFVHGYLIVFRGSRLF
jgi:hypothetical protein